MGFSEQSAFVEFLSAWGHVESRVLVEEVDGLH